MTKEDLLREIEAKIASGEMRREDVMARFAPQNASMEEGNARHFSVTKMLYVVGAAIIVVGIVIFVSQIWDDIGPFGRVSVTLGLGLLITALGSMLRKERPQETIGHVFHAIGGALVPGGALVTLSELSTGDNHPWVIALTFIVIFTFYLALNAIHKSPVLSLFAIANGTASIYLVTNAILADTRSSDYWDIFAYLTMAIGASYLSLGHAFRDGWNRGLTGILYFFGSVGLLGAAFSRVFDSTGWQILYFAIVFACLYLATLLKSKTVLIISTLFLVAHVSYITSEYFADSLGWPISLVILGFVFIGLGYASLAINRKYIAS